MAGHNATYWKLQRNQFATRDGTPYTLAEFGPQHVNIDHMLERLSKENRWNGETRHPWSVAAHSLLMYWEAKKRRITDRRELRSILLHDAHEAWVKDLPSWLKTLPEIAGPFGAITERVDSVLREVLDFDARAYPSVKELDDWAGRLEYEELIYPGIEVVFCQQRGWYHDFLSMKIAYGEVKA